MRRAYGQVTDGGEAAAGAAAGILVEDADGLAGKEGFLAGGSDSSGSGASSSSHDQGSLVGTTVDKDDPMYGCWFKFYRSYYEVVFAEHLSKLSKKVFPSRMKTSTNFLNFNWKCKSSKLLL